MSSEQKPAESAPTSECENCEYTASELAAAREAGEQAGYLRGLRAAVDVVTDPRRREQYVMHGPRMGLAIAGEIRALIEKAQA